MISSKTAIIYCRVSTDKQGQNWDSLDVQEKECRAYCERMHITVVEVFREQFTGTSIQRPALTEALQYLKKQKREISYCIIHKLDRSTRGGLGDYYEIKKQFEKYGTHLKDVYGVIQDDINVVNVDNFDTSIYDWSKINPSEIAVSMTVLSAKQERSSILQRTIPQEIRNTQNGYISRQSHFGYQNQKICTEEGKLKTTYIPDPIESKWIQAIFELRARNDMSDREIAEAVNLMGFKTRSIKKWNKNRTMIIGDAWNNPLDVKLLQSYIQKPVYAGIISEKWTGWKPVKGKFTWLVSIDLFNRANRGKVEIIESKGWAITILYGKERKTEKIVAKRVHFHSDYPFSRVIRCPYCENYLTPNKSTSWNGTLHYYYQCNGKKWIKHKNYTERRDELNETVINFLSHVSLNKDYMPKFLDKIDEVWNERKHEIERERANTKQEIGELEQARVGISANIEKFIDYPEILKTKNDELKEINRKIESLKSQRFVDETEKEKSAFIDFTQNILKHISNMLQEEKSIESVWVIFDILFETLPTYENIKSQTTSLYPIFALESKKRTIDDSLVCSGIENNAWWQLCSESNWGQRLWRPLH